MYRAKNLSGIRFGKLTALEPTEKREAHYIVWRCKCDCGNECFVDSKRLQRGTVTNCGCIPKRQSSAFLDLTGEKYGDLTVLARAENKGTRTAWRCRCDCGNEKVVTTHDLRAGHTKSCGCKSHDTPFYLDLNGRRFGYLTVTGKTEKRDYKGSVMWSCHCDCGNDLIYSADSLIHGNVVSCGCYREKELCKKLKERLHRVDGTCIERLNLQKPRSDNRSGHIGVHMVDGNTYRVFIGFKGKRYYLGTYATVEEAVKARCRGEEIHLNFLEQYYQGKLKSQNI